MKRPTPPEITDTTRPLRWLRRFFGVLLAVSLTLGTLASIDTFVSQVRTPAETTAVVAGDTVELSGSFESHEREIPSHVQAFLRPETQLITINGTGMVPMDDPGKPVRWRTSITVDPEAAPGLYEIRLVPVSSRNDALSQGGLWHIDVHPDAESLRAASHSVFLSWTRTEPLPLAAASLVLAIVAAVSYVLLYRYTVRLLARRGYLRVYHAKEDGDDTMLYCVDARNQAEANTSYPVMTAAGQTLGLAAVEERGRRYVVFRLCAARARPGCVVALLG